jgi:hypothetical protein
MSSGEAAARYLDVSFGHKAGAWSFPDFDAITVSWADAQRPNEISSHQSGAGPPRASTPPDLEEPRRCSTN